MHPFSCILTHRSLFYLFNYLNRAVHPNVALYIISKQKCANKKNDM